MRYALILLLTTDLIDRRIEERWEAERARPAPVADDYEFLRRLSIDLRGIIPTAHEVRAFAADAGARKREKTIDAWLRSDAFARHWAFRTAEQLGMAPTYGDRIHDYHDDFRGWLRDALRSNMPYDRLARRIVTAHGPTDLDPAAVFLMNALFDPNGAMDAAERLSRVFLGMQIRCAECHDHPFDNWTQADFHAMTSFFRQTRADGRKQKNGEQWRLIGWLDDDPSRGDAKHPPRYKATDAEPQPGESRRIAFARMLVADPQFARATVNRHWGMLMGRGFVHPFDGFAAGRKPSHPELLEELAEEFARSKYDLRALLRSILLSKPYQLSSRGDAAESLFARSRAVPMTPEQLFDSVLRATGAEDRPIATNSKLGPGTVRDAFMREFRPANLAPNAAASSEPTIAQALFFLNGELTATSARLATVGEPEQRLEEMFLATLSRPPNARERDALLKRIRKADGEARIYEDILWALVNSTEFVTRR